MASLLIMASCVKNDVVDDSITRTVLIYIAADNSLSTNANPNIYSMQAAVSKGMDNVRLLVYVDRMGVKPALLHIHDHRIDTVRAYQESNSASSETLRKVIRDVVDGWQSEQYGLLLWSHGTGWLPQSKLHYVAPDLGYAQSRTKAFACEDKDTWIEIDDLADAIPDGLFDYIAFDACYMANVEVMYALRNKARYIISSTCEIPSSGFPYHNATRDLLNGNLMRVCSQFHSYYNSMSGWDKMACISLTKTDGLDSLARCFSKIVRQFKNSIPSMDVEGIQRYDRFNNHVFYDLEDFVEKLNPAKEDLNEFRLQLERCVVYKINTPYLFPGDSKDELKIDTHCGLSVYIPIRKYDQPGLNAEYRKTEWSKNTGY